MCFGKKQRKKDKNATVLLTALKSTKICLQTFSKNLFSLEYLKKLFIKAIDL